MDKIRYEFTYADQAVAFDVDLERQLINPIEGPAWTELKHYQCENCPLNAAENPRCPAAYDIHKVAEAFKDLSSITPCTVKVITGERSYEKHCSAQEGLRSLFGLILATSACPVLSRMKPMARQHLPFAGLNDTLVRLSGAYFITQYVKSLDGQPVNWDLDALKNYIKELVEINKQLMQRLHDVTEKDSVLNAIYGFVAFSETAEFNLDSLMIELKATYLDAF